MIAFLEGRVIERDESELVVGVNGVGYRVMADTRSFDVGRDAELWIHSITSAEAGTRLFGFQTQAERDLFVELLGVKGVGPKTALAVVSRGITLVRNALTRSDVAGLVSKGCGQKSAAAIVEKLGGAA